MKVYFPIWIDFHIFWQFTSHVYKGIIWVLSILMSLRISTNHVGNFKLFGIYFGKFSIPTSWLSKCPFL
jgi:hypothetical protein